MTNLCHHEALTTAASLRTLASTEGGTVFYFHEFLARLDLDLEQTRLLRHDNSGLVAWRRGGFQKFGCFASFQRRTPSPYAEAQLACHFIPGPILADGDATGLFVGITRIVDRWDCKGGGLPAIANAKSSRGSAVGRMCKRSALNGLRQGWGIGARPGALRGACRFCERNSAAVGARSEAVRQRRTLARLANAFRCRPKAELVAPCLSRG